MPICQRLLPLMAAVASCCLGAGIDDLVPTLVVTPLPVGSGARALGRGGAFVAVADDATAASWNPAGLVQLESPECSVVGSYLSVASRFSSNEPGMHMGDEYVGRPDLNYLSVALPFRLGRTNMVASLNYQQKFDFHQELSLTEAEGGAFPSHSRAELEAEGGIGALSPALGVQISPTFSLGLAVNCFGDEFFGGNAWEENIRGVITAQTLVGEVIGRYEQKVTFRNFRGLNVALGTLWDAWEQEERRVTLGAVLKSPFRARADRASRFSSATTIGGGAPNYVRTKRREEYKIDYPTSAAAGVAVQFSDLLSCACDVTWTDWSKFDQTGSESGQTLPIGGQEGEQRGIDDTYDARLGLEYLLVRENAIFPLRAGVFYEQRPSLGNANGVLGFSLGGGVTTNGYSIDWAYQYRSVRNAKSADLGIPGARYDLAEHLFLTSLIWYF